MNDYSEIIIRGEWYYGDPLKITLTAEMLPAVDVVDRIETKIKSMRSLYNEFLIVDLQTADPYDKEFPVYFQMLRNRKFGKTNTYHIELGMMLEHGIILYKKDELTLGGAIELFEKTCVNREKPDKSEWRLGSHVYAFKDNTDGREKADEKNRLERCNRFLSKYRQKTICGIGAEFAEYEALEYMDENDPDPEYACALAREYERRGLYSKLRRLFETTSYNPVIAQINGEMALHGVLGAPDYKTAYEYFIHANTIGSLLAEYYIAKMYRYGLYVNKDHAEYERRIRSVYEKYLNSLIECCPHQIFLEMSEIEQRAGNIDKAIEHCVMSLKTLRLMMRVGGNITDTDLKIVNRLYGLVEFDPDDMDLLDLLYVFNKPSKVRIVIGNVQLIVQAIDHKGRTIVKCGKSYYRDAADFLQNHKIKDKCIATYINNISYMEIL